MNESTKHNCKLSDTNLTEKQWNILKWHIDQVDEFNDMGLAVIKRGLRHDEFWGLINEEDLQKIKAALIDIMQIEETCACTKEN